MSKENGKDAVEEFLRRELGSAETELAEGELRLEPLREKVRKLRGSLAEYTAGSRGSQGIDDLTIVNLLKKSASEDKPLRAPELAARLGVDTRGISRRLPRMRDDGMIAGDAEEGYYVSSARVKR